MIVELSIRARSKAIAGILGCEVMLELSTTRESRIYVWTDGDGPTCSGGASEQTAHLAVNTSGAFIERKLVVEAIVPAGGRVLYALLGVELKPDEAADGLAVRIQCTDELGEPFGGAQNFGDPVHCGLPNEYATGVVREIQRRKDDLSRLAAGELLFHTGAHAEVGSSRLMFAKCTNFLVDALINPAIDTTGFQLSADYWFSSKSKAVFSAS